MSPTYLHKTDKGCLRKPSKMEWVTKLDWASDGLGNGSVPEKLFLTSSLDYSDGVTHTAGLQVVPRSVPSHHNFLFNLTFCYHSLYFFRGSAQISSS